MPENKCLYITRSKGQIGDFLGERVCFFIDHQISECTYVSNTAYTENKLECHSIDDVHDYNGFQFGRTVIFYEDNSFNEGKQETNHYYATDVVLIRKELIDSN